MKIKIGLPKGMYYFDYSILWRNFFNYMGLDTLASKKTNREILDSGIKYCVDEACLPVKIYHGHVYSLKDKVDYMFIPKIMSLAKKEYGCPKHLGLPEMIENSIDDLAPILSPEINLFKGRNKLYDELLQLGKVFYISERDTIAAFEKAYNDYNLDKKKYMKDSKYRRDNNILVLGHPYIIKDNFLNMNIDEKIKEYKYQILTPENMEEERQRDRCKGLDKRMFWTQGQKILGTSMELLREKSIRGIIYISAFGCGLDSVFLNYIEIMAKSKEVPFTILTIDEQTGEAGINTRVEAFMDMVKWRYENENYLSSFR